MDDFARTLYRRAPASVMTLASFVLSYGVKCALDDYTQYNSLGHGGLGKTSVLTWIVHTLVLRPLGMSHEAATDPEYLPLDDTEWQEKCAGIDANSITPLSHLALRDKSRPFVYGIVPQRQIEQCLDEKSDLQVEIISYMETLASRYPLALSLAFSTYEGHTSPCLFVRHLDEHEDKGKDFAHPTKLARVYLGGTPAPQRALVKGSDNSLQASQALLRDPTKHELVHLHMIDGSLHMTLSPQDARVVVEKKWGELHRLAGVAYRGYYMPPYWLPRSLYFGHEPSRVRWGYQMAQIKQSQAQSKALPKGMLLPPTYTLIYAPRTRQELSIVLQILDQSVAWALGKPM